MDKFASLKRLGQFSLQVWSGSKGNVNYPSECGTKNVNAHNHKKTLKMASLKMATFACNFASRTPPVKQSTQAFLAVLQKLAEHHTGLCVAPLKQSELVEGQTLLYNVYHREQQWTPRPGNPSNLRIENGLLLDDHDESSILIGARAKHTNELIGVTRVMANDRKPLEFSGYDATFRVPEDGVFSELNRVAVKKDWRKSGAVHYLMCYGVLTATVEWNASLVLGAVEASKVETLASRFHGYVLQDASVRYEDNEERLFVVFEDSMPYRSAVLNTVTSLPTGTKVE